jgi:hypothetical protein
MKTTRTLVASVLLFLLIGLGGCGKGGLIPGVDDVAPEPGATLAGPVDMAGKAASATIYLVVSADGASITTVGIILDDLKTETVSIGSLTEQFGGNVAISHGAFAGTVSGLGEIEGRFTSATEASGTVKLNLDLPYSAPADLGEFTWSAAAAEPGSAPFTTLGPPVEQTVPPTPSLP